MRLRHLFSKPKQSEEGLWKTLYTRRSILEFPVCQLSFSARRRCRSDISNLIADVHRLLWALQRLDKEKKLTGIQFLIKQASEAEADLVANLEDFESALSLAYESAQNSRQGGG
jgi:hypothetical protein